MIENELNPLIWSALTLGCFVVGLFFLRFWSLSRERLFFYFMLAFWVLAGDYLGLALLKPTTETRSALYLVRLLAFVLIIVGIVDKNRRGKRS